MLAPTKAFLDACTAIYEKQLLEFKAKEAKIKASGRGAGLRRRAPPNLNAIQVSKKLDLYTIHLTIACLPLALFSKVVAVVEASERHELPYQKDIKVGLKGSEFVKTSLEHFQCISSCPLLDKMLDDVQTSPSFSKKAFMRQAEIRHRSSFLLPLICSYCVGCESVGDMIAAVGPHEFSTESERFVTACLDFKWKRGQLEGRGGAAIDRTSSKPAASFLNFVVAAWEAKQIVQQGAEEVSVEAKCGGAVTTVAFRDGTTFSREVFVCGASGGDPQQWCSDACLQLLQKCGKEFVMSMSVHSDTDVNFLNKALAAMRLPSGDGSFMGAVVLHPERTRSHPHTVLDRLVVANTNAPYTLFTYEIQFYLETGVRLLWVPEDADWRMCSSSYRHFVTYIVPRTRRLTLDTESTKLLGFGNVIKLPTNVDDVQQLRLRGQLVTEGAMKALFSPMLQQLKLYSVVVFADDREHYMGYFVALPADVMFGSYDKTRVAAFTLKIVEAANMMKCRAAAEDDDQLEEPSRKRKRVDVGESPVKPPPKRLKKVSRNFDLAHIFQVTKAGKEAGAEPVAEEAAATPKQVSSPKKARLVRFNLY